VLDELNRFAKSPPPTHIHPSYNSENTALSEFARTTHRKPPLHLIKKASYTATKKENRELEFLRFITHPLPIEEHLVEDFLW
jgi:hypothetical protein